MARLTTPLREPLEDQGQTARRLGVQPRTLEKWRLTGVGPPFIVLGRRCVRYDPAAVEGWLASRQRTSTSDRGPNPRPTA